MASQYPAVSALTAQMEMFCMSKRELEQKFTKSEMALLAWRSQEMSSQLQQQSEKSFSRESLTQPDKKRKHYYDASVPQDLPDHFYNEDGEVDLRKVTGAEAYQYFQKVGIKLPVIRL